MNKKIKVAIVTVLTVAFVWISQVWLSSFSAENTYLSDAILILYPPLIIIALSVYFFIRKEKDIAKGIIIGGLIYYLILWLNIWSDISEMSCQRYFFNLFTNCP
ncbi:MAG: hypothetical protein AAB488_02825 [Patescibacteria group bacterium]